MTGTKRVGRRRVAIGAVLATMALAVLAACQPIGGATDTFGNDPTRAGAQPNFWTSINGPYTNHADGDPYATKCHLRPASATACDSDGANPTYNSVGEVFGVDVPPADIGSPMTVSIYDPGMAGSAVTYESIQLQSFATSYQLFDTTGAGSEIDLGQANSMSALGRCSGPGTGTKVFAAGSTESQNAWYALCTFTPTVAGTYPVQVKSSAIPGVTDSGGGYNNFSVRATTSAAVKPTVAALGQASLWFVQSGTIRSYLVDVPTSSAGHTMLVDLFDPGDGPSGTSTVQILAPPSGAPAVVPSIGSPVACSYSDPSPNLGSATTKTSATCVVTTRDPGLAAPNVYNNAWLRIAVPIPANYSCSTDCWWTMADVFTDTPTDRVVYKVSIS